MPAIKCLLPLLPLCSAAALATAAHAETPTNGFDLSGSSRLRVETIAGQARADFNSDDTLVNLRTQLFLQYRKGAVEIGAELYDSRAWGADPGTPLTTGEINALEPVQA